MQHEIKFRRGMKSRELFGRSYGPGDIRKSGIRTRKKERTRQTAKEVGRTDSLYVGVLARLFWRYELRDSRIARGRHCTRYDDASSVKSKFLAQLM